MEVLIKEMDSRHIPEVGKVHRESFEVFFPLLSGPGLLAGVIRFINKGSLRDLPGRSE